MIEEHKALASKGAELVEFRLDYMRNRPDIGRLLKDRPTPVVVTCRRKTDRGRWNGTEDQRLAILREAIIAGGKFRRSRRRHRRFHSPLWQNQTHRQLP
jgi:3-dehydroquinate dehydratase/shikimate dehydrogenase